MQIFSLLVRAFVQFPVATIRAGAISLLRRSRLNNACSQPTSHCIASVKILIKIQLLLTITNGGRGGGGERGKDRIRQGKKLDKKKRKRERVTEKNRDRLTKRR